MSLVEVLNPDSGLVTTGPPMLTQRSGFALVASPDRNTLYAIALVHLDLARSAPICSR